TWSRQMRTHTTRTPNGRKRSAPAQRRKRPGPIMVLRSKRESHRTRKREISICSKTAPSGESECALRAVRGASPRTFLNVIQHSARDIRPVDWRERQSQVATATAPRKTTCANPAVVTSSDADEQLRAF